MLRRATFSDLPRLLELMVETHARSKYADRGISLDQTVARTILQAALSRNGMQMETAMLLNVVVKDGEVEGFMIGVLQRVHSVCNRLEAQDMWLSCSERAPRGAMQKLIDAYIEWADTNPKVAEISLSWTDVVKGVDGDALGKVYQRKGFTRAGEIWKRESQ